MLLQIVPYLMWLATILNMLGLVFTIWSKKAQNKYINSVIHENVELNAKNYRLRMELIDAQAMAALYKNERDLYYEKRI